jgi:hypothetical protein
MSASAPILPLRDNAAAPAFNASPLPCYEILEVEVHISTVTYNIR